MPGRMNNTFYNPMISLIVPVYNAEEYLDDAVKSVWDQSFANWELLLIDDGSTDKSGEICDQFAEADHRIKVFHTENGGYNRARNIGIENASGEWVMFLDSDDYLAPDALQHMVDWSERSDLVMALYVNLLVMVLVGKCTRPPRFRIMVLAEMVLCLRQECVSL